MAAPPLACVLRHINRAVGRELADDLPDGELLRRFVAARDESAFTELARRHAPMVWGVCRRVLGNSPDADDAFQATFLILGRKAHAVAVGDLVGHWLYRVACRVAARARADSAWQHAHQREMFDMSAADTSEELTRLDLRSVLDEELSRLPERYRAPLVLCYLQGKSYEEAARLLGCPAGTISGRLARARRLLRQRLARRGLACSATALAAVTGPAMAGPVPRVLLGDTIRAALRVAAVGAGAFSARVTNLAEGVIGAMWTTKTKMVTAVFLALCLLGGGAALRPGASAVEPPAAQAPAAQKAEGGQPGPAASLRELWSELASPDDARAARAVLALSRMPREAVALARERLGPVKADPKRVARLVADLDSPQFAVRERAREVLEYLGQYVKDDLKNALKANPNEELRRRLEKLLARLGKEVPPAGQPLTADARLKRLSALNQLAVFTDRSQSPILGTNVNARTTLVRTSSAEAGTFLFGTDPTSLTLTRTNLNTAGKVLTSLDGRNVNVVTFVDRGTVLDTLSTQRQAKPQSPPAPERPSAPWLRAVRAIAVLEHVGTPEARAALVEIAGGEPDALPTREARAALGRLNARAGR